MLQPELFDEFMPLDTEPESWGLTGTKAYNLVTHR